MRLRGIHVYVGLIFLVGVGAQSLLDWGSVLNFGQADLVGFAALTILGLVSEGLALNVSFSGSAGNSSITFIPLSAAVLIFGPAAAVLFLLLTGGVAEVFVRRKGLLRAIFNIGQYLLSTALAGWAFTKAGGLPWGTPGTGFGQILAFALFGLTFLVLNHTFVSVAVAIHQGHSPRKVLTVMAGSSGSNIGYDLIVSPIAVAVAYLYVQLQVWGLILILLPLYFIRHAYQTNYKLQRANQDLLNALVKAIETRDPYTSGHSRRVANLAHLIAERMGLKKEQVEVIRTAAYLHDVGKIDAIFAAILRKDGSLTPEERSIIQSHATRGADLLREYASYSNEIIAAVRHHHERLDGSGYPDGLRGDAIPLAARIISACDAIDAMLSDRPYRKALAIPEVHSELSSGRGVQFDESIVNCVISSNLLELHQETVANEEETTIELRLLDGEGRKKQPIPPFARMSRRATREPGHAPARS